MSIFSFLYHLFILIVLSNPVFGQEVRNYPMEDRALLWKIEGNGVKTKSYLFGTVHLIDKEHFHFPKKLQKIVAKSDVLAMEIAGLPDPAEALKLSMLEDGSFFDFFTEVQTDSILVWVEEHTSMTGKSFKMVVGKLKPFVVSQMLVELDEKNPNRGMENKESYEVELEAIAEEKGLEIAGFETVIEQMGFFDSFTDEQQTDMVMSTIRDEYGSTSEEMDKMMALFDDQNIDGLYQMIGEEEGITEEMNDLILTDRNKRWIPKIESMISEKSTFIAVGAGHLGGPEGVIRLLEAKGYTLTPVKL